MMSSLIRNYYDAFNERRFADAVELFAENAEVELIPRQAERGGAGYVRFADAWVRAFPDAMFTVQSVEQRSESLSEVYLLATGTHHGVLDFGMYRFAPSGVHAALHLRELLDIRDQKIAATTLTVDLNDMVTQLTSVDYGELERRVRQICALGDELAQAAGEPMQRRELANRLGLELDAARRAVRPHFYR